jgi:hypothetical protein
MESGAGLRPALPGWTCAISLGSEPITAGITCDSSLGLVSLPKSTKGVQALAMFRTLTVFRPWLPPLLSPMQQRASAGRSPAPLLHPAAVLVCSKQALSCAAAKSSRGCGASAADGEPNELSKLRKAGSARRFLLHALRGVPPWFRTVSTAKFASGGFPARGVGAPPAGFRARVRPVGWHGPNSKAAGTSQWLGLWRRTGRGLLRQDGLVFNQSTSGTDCAAAGPVWARRRRRFLALPHDVATRASTEHPTRGTSHESGTGRAVSGGKRAT